MYIQCEPGKSRKQKVTVGHVPLTLSRTFHLFLKNGGDISVTVGGKRRKKGTGLEIPATYEFKNKKPSKTNKLIKNLKDKEVKDD